MVILKTHNASNTLVVGFGSSVSAETRCNSWHESKTPQDLGKYGIERSWMVSSRRVKQGPMELTVIMMCMANIILIALRLSVKLGAECQLGVLMLHLTKPAQEMG